MHRRPSAAYALVLFLIVACGSPAPSASPSQVESPGPAVACLSVQGDECQVLLAGAVATLPAVHPEVVAATIQASGCQTPPCPPGLAARGSGQAILEYADGAGFAIVSLSLESGAVRYRAEEAFATGPMQPTSKPAAPAGVFALGHCGLSSPVDYDGSFWDPVGQIDGDHGDAINSAAGVIRLLAADTAEFRSESGFTVGLRRHDGPKAFLPCM